MHYIIGLGGDTDTNAAIVGGMVGAIIGFQALPKDYLEKMLRLDFTDKSLKRGHDRPIFYEPRRVLSKIY
jgi:ADP-ribosylglycohydrolase